MLLQFIGRRSSRLLLKPVILGNLETLNNQSIEKLPNLIFRSIYRNYGQVFQKSKNFRIILANTKTNSHSFSTISGSKPPTTTIGLADQALGASKENKGEESGSKGQDEGAEDETKKKANATRALKYTMIAFGSIFFGAASYIFFVYGAPLTDKTGKELKDEFSDLPIMEQYYRRSVSEVRNYIKVIKEPSRDKLLPDPAKYPYHQPPYTLLIELTGVLVHPDWTYKTGWRFKKRPGVDYFLQQIAQGYNFEIVIYTSEQGFTAFPIIDALDPHGTVIYRLFRDSTKYENGVHIKDLDRINRDLKRVIVIDCNDKTVKDHRNNAIVLPRWKGNDDDRDLFELAMLLQTISSNSIDDVRSVLEYYSGFDDPIFAFRERQRQYLEQEKEQKEKPAAGVGLSPRSVLSLFRKPQST